MNRSSCASAASPGASWQPGLSGAAALCALGGIPAHSVFGRIAHAVAPPRELENRILVVFEMSGGNDGLNTVVPYGDDAYYRHRPTIGLKPDGLLRLDDHFALNPGMVGFERLWQGGPARDRARLRLRQPVVLALHLDGVLAHRRAQQRRRIRLGRAARRRHAAGRRANVHRQRRQPRSRSRCKSRDHVPVVFDDPEKFRREGFFEERALFEHVAADPPTATPRASTCAASRRARSTPRRWCARPAPATARPIDYGLVPLDLPKIAALIAADVPARLYYTSFRDNAFDTHVHQNDLHSACSPTPPMRSPRSWPTWSGSGAPTT